MSGNRSAMSASMEFSQLARDLHKMGPAIRRGLRADFTRIGQASLSDARSRAGAWSSRIPAAIFIRPITDTTRGRVGVELVVSKNVPHARPYEGISQQGSSAYFRHPVFGHTERKWARQDTRPYAWPAVKGRAGDANRAVQDTFDAAARECGFR